MHLADGIVNHPGLTLGVGALTALGLGFASQRLSRTDAQPRLAWAGTVGAFVLVAQTINLPLLPGVSAHAIGSSLATLVLGPELAVAVLCCVLMVQAFLLGDGGITTLGLNALNLAFLPTLAMWAASRGRPKLSLLRVIAGTLAGNLAGACVLALVLVLGAGAPPTWTFGWLLSVQSAAGIAEGGLTFLAWRALQERASESAQDSAGDRLLSLDRQRSPRAAPSPRAPAWRWTALALGLMLALIPLSSGSPDALEVVVERLRP